MKRVSILVLVFVLVLSVTTTAFASVDNYLKKLKGSCTKVARKAV